MINLPWRELDTKDQLTLLLHCEGTPSLSLAIALNAASHCQEKIIPVYTRKPLKKTVTKSSHY